MPSKSSQIYVRARTQNLPGGSNNHKNRVQVNYVRTRKKPVPPRVIFGLSILIGLLASIVLILTAIFSIYGYYQLSGKIIPGVYVQELPVGGKTETDAGILIHKTWNLEHRINVYDEFNNLSISPLILGIQVDPLATVQAALKTGRSGGFLNDIRAIYSSYKNGVHIQPIVTFDEMGARSGLESLIPQMSREAINPTIRIENGNLVEVPGMPGYTINVQDTFAEIQKKPSEILLGGRLLILTKTVPPDIDDLRELFDQAEILLSQSVNINAYDPILDKQMHWSTSREDLAAWLIVQEDEGVPRITLDENLAQEYLLQLSRSLEPERRLDIDSIGDQLTDTIHNKKPLSISIKHNPTTYTVKSGDTLLKIGWKLGMPFWKILEANPDVDPDNLWAGTDLIIPSKDALIPLPVIPGKRIKIDIGDQSLTIYQNNEKIKKYPISTGIDRSPTQPGVFQVLTHKRNAYASVWDLHMPDFLGIYEAWPGFMNGIHGLPTLANGQRLWANILGKPASYGCIILDTEAARWLYEWAENGVVVEITP